MASRRNKDEKARARKEGRKRNMLVGVGIGTPLKIA
jgi:hypothetical protein